MSKTGNKYHRRIFAVDSLEQSQTVDVYNVLDAFNVECPARQHAIKKLLCAGLRGKGDSLQDLREALEATERAVALEMQRMGSSVPKPFTPPRPPPQPPSDNWDRAARAFGV